MTERHDLKELRHFERLTRPSSEDVAQRMLDQADGARAYRQRHNLQPSRRGLDLLADAVLDFPVCPECGEPTSFDADICEDCVVEIALTLRRNRDYEAKQAQPRPGIFRSAWDVVKFVLGLAAGWYVLSLFLSGHWRGL